MGIEEIATEETENPVVGEATQTTFAPGYNMFGVPLRAATVDILFISLKLHIQSNVLNMKLNIRQ